MIRDHNYEKLCRHCDICQAYVSLLLLNFYDGRELNFCKQCYDERRQTFQGATEVSDIFQLPFEIEKKISEDQADQHRNSQKRLGGEWRQRNMRRNSGAIAIQQFYRSYRIQNRGSTDRDELNTVIASKRRQSSLRILSLASILKNKEKCFNVKVSKGRQIFTFFIPRALRIRRRTKV